MRIIKSKKLTALNMTNEIQSWDYRLNFDISVSVLYIDTESSCLMKCVFELGICDCHLNS